MKNKIILITLLLIPLFSWSQETKKISDTDLVTYKLFFEEAQADAILLMQKLKSPAQCYTTFNKLSGYQAMQKDSFAFDKAKLLKRSVLCFDNDSGYLSTSNSEYRKISENTFLSFNVSNQGELVEILQLDLIDNKMKYSKSLIVKDKKSLYYPMTGIMAVMGDMIKITQ